MHRITFYNRLGDTLDTFHMPSVPGLGDRVRLRRDGKTCIWEVKKVVWMLDEIISRSQQSVEIELFYLGPITDTKKDETP